MFMKIVVEEWAEKNTKGRDVCGVSSSPTHLVAVTL